MNLYEHAPDGRLLWSEDANGQPTDYTYDSQTGNLLTVKAPDPDGSGPLGRPTTSYRYNEAKIGTSTTAGTQQTGLKAEWYANQTLSGIPKTTTWAPTSGGILDENWSTTGPAALSGSTSSWSVRFSGTIDLPSSGDYSFRLSVDDGAQVWVDDKLVAGDWSSGTLRNVTGDPIPLDAGSHRIVVEYFQGSSSSELHLLWEKPGDTSYSLIPYNQTAPSYGQQTSTVSPEGEVSFSHYSDPVSGQPDYTQSGGSLRLVNSFTYDALGRILTRVQPKGNAALTIDSAGDLSGTPSAAYVTTYGYYSDSATAAPPSGCPSGSAVNQAGQLQTISRPGYADQTSVYDAAGRVLASTKGKGTTCSTYDAEGRLLSQRVPGDATISSCASDSSATACYIYDPAGLQRSARTAGGEVDLAYDEDGHVIRSTQKDASGAVFGESSIDFSDQGNPESMLVAAGPLSTTTNYHYETGFNQENQVTSQKVIDPFGGQQEQGEYHYDAAGRLTVAQNLDVGLGQYTWFEYNNDNQITAAHTLHGSMCSQPCTPTDSNPYAEYAYTRDQDGRITSQTLTGGGLTSATTSYSYDAASRLATATEPSGLVRTYHYDEDSNRTSIDEHPSGGSLATIATYTYSTSAQDRLSSISASATTNYTYSTDGETLTYGTNTLTWNGRDKIASDAPTSTSNVAYTYDPLGRLQERSTTGPTADNAYIYVGTSDTPTMVTDGAGTITQSYVSGPLGIRRANNGPPIVSGMPNGSGELYFTDGIGNTAGTINLSGTRTNTYTYDAFGTPNQTTPTNTLTNRFLGKNSRPLDTLSGLVLMGARPYDSSLGRFLSADPVEGGSANLFDYVNQNPLNELDINGTCSTQAAGGPAPGTSPGKCTKKMEGRVWKDPFTGKSYKCVMHLGKWEWVPIEEASPHPQPGESRTAIELPRLKSRASVKHPTLVAIPTFGLVFGG
ncbi:MAG TPA: PA14 domain-containing protein, partial [Microbacteriaceae bacterium]|nr:PA14 domain-containing protein [Microbacteriaceae bacterium]